MVGDNVPAVSLAVVQHGRIVYLKAYGRARLPDRPADIATRFGIGSITKQFTAAAVLLLVDRHKLSLDDRVGKFLPDLTDANNITVRELLSHTSGYEDYLSQEYLPTRVQQPTSVDAILSNWGKRPLDFEPASQWQYSGTNYVIAGRIIERITGQSYEKFLTENVLRPVGITDAGFIDESPPEKNDAVGYYRFGIGPPRVAPVAGRDWLFAMADLVMTARDVALWDLSVLSRRLLSQSAYKAMTTPVKTSNGKETPYGLGFFITDITGTDGKQHLMLSHPGEISGFRSQNWIIPDTGTALVVLTNAEYSDAGEEIGGVLQNILALAAQQPARNSQQQSPGSAKAQTPIERRAAKLLAELARGTVDRSQLAPDAAAMFTPRALRDIEGSLSAIGTLQSVALTSIQLRGGMKHYSFTATYDRRTLQVQEYDLPTAKLRSSSSTHPDRSRPENRREGLENEAPAIRA